MQGLMVPKFIDIESISAFAGKLGAIEKVVLDFSRVGFAVPTGMVLLASVISRAVGEGRVVSITGVEPYGYAANVGFYEACGLDVPKNPAPGGANYYPVTRLDVCNIRATAESCGKPLGEQVNVVVGRLAYMLTRETRGDLFNTVKYCLREIIRNVAEHSESGDLLVTGQFWPVTKEVELAVLDHGIGLRRSLSRNPRFDNIDSDEKAIRVALLPSTSGAINSDGEWGNSGFGLYITSQMARRSGRFIIASGTANLELRQKTRKVGSFFLSGTLVSMKFNVERVGRLDTYLRAVSAKGESLARRYLELGPNEMASAASRSIVVDEEWR